jgi:DNA-binding XRE family transcriptional regulator
VPVGRAIGVEFGREPDRDNFSQRCARVALSDVDALAPRLSGLSEFTALTRWFHVVALLLHSIYATSMSRKAKSEEPAVANRVEEIRSAQSITRQDLAQQVGVHYQTIGYIERGEYSPSLVLALQISRALSKPVEQLFWLDLEENK